MKMKCCGDRKSEPGLSFPRVVLTRGSDDVGMVRFRLGT